MPGVSRSFAIPNTEQKADMLTMKKHPSSLAVLPLTVEGLHVSVADLAR
jgi:hypothetical protein